jgi:hypothetical protein
MTYLPLLLVSYFMLLNAALPPWSLGFVTR